MKKLSEKLKEKLHISWFLAIGFLGAILGIGLSLLVYIGFVDWWVWLIIIAILMAGIWRLPKVYMVWSALLIGLLVGLWRGGLERVDLNKWSEFYGQDIIITGVVAEDPDFGYSNDLRVKLTDVHIGETKLPGTVWASVGSGPKREVKRSDIVTISGRLKQGFANFPASLSFAKLTSITRTKNSDIARDIRDAFADKLMTVLEAPKNDLGMGILAGQKRALPLQLTEAFKIAGLTHIIVASGYNLTVLVRFARRLFGKISRFAAAMGASGMVIFFACITGFGPSMTRAMIVAMLSLWTWYYGRKTHPATLLLFVAGATALYQPYYVWGDAGWYMSFTAFFGVIILSPLLQKYFWGDKKAGVIRQTFVDTLCASVCTMPIIAFFMGTLSPFGMISNILVLPIIPFTMLATAVVGGLAFVVWPVAKFLAFAPDILLGWVVEVAKRVASLPGALLETELSLIWVVVIYTAIILGVFYMKSKTKFSFKNNYLTE